MEFKYGNWLLIREMSGFMTADLGDVQLVQEPGGYEYNFEMDGRAYNVSFVGPDEWIAWSAKGSVLLTENKYNISFSYGKGKMDLPRDTKSPTAVYGQLFKVVKKFLQQVNPEALDFVGVNYEQDVMYEMFYKKWLSKAFTRVGNQRYLRNDLYKKYMQANGKEAIALNTIDQEDKMFRDAALQKGRNLRNAKRKERLGQKPDPYQGAAPIAPPRRDKSPMQQLNMKRGQRTPQGGIYVGTTPTGTDWVAYDDNQFQNMSQRFDSQYGAKQ